MRDLLRRPGTASDGDKARDRKNGDRLCMPDYEIVARHRNRPQRAPGIGAPWGLGAISSPRLNRRIFGLVF